MPNNFSDVCCICKRLFERGKQKLECSKCTTPAHRTCLPSMTSSEFAHFKTSWKCKRCCDGSREEEEEESSSEENSCSEEEDEDYRYPLGESETGVVEGFSSLTITGRRSQERKFKFAHLNINGIKGKFPEVCEYLSKDKDIAVLALTESKLQENDKSYMIPGFHVEKIDRPNGDKGGGQLIYIIEDSYKYQVETLPEIPPGLVECNIMKISSKVEMVFTILLCVIYVPPRDVRNSFFEFFAEICRFLTSPKNFRSRVVIMGDFNVNWLENSSYKRKLVEILEENGLVQVIKKPTRGDALLDHIYVKREDAANTVCKVVKDASTSDHGLTWMYFK